MDDSNNSKTDEIDLTRIINILYKSKFTLLSFTLLFGVLFAAYSITLPNKYTSKAILSPAENSDSISSSVGAYGGLTALAGINISSPSSSIDVAVETLKSYKFFEDRLSIKIKLQDLIATKSWDPVANEISYDTSAFDSENNKWIRKPSGRKKTTPSYLEAYEIFHTDNFNINRNANTGFITLSMTHHSPYIAQKWLSDLIIEINRKLREDEKKRATLAVNYLNEQIYQTNLTEIKQGLAELIKREINNLALIEANEEYVFKTIDPPILPELKSSPRRSLISLLGLIVGLVFGAMFILLTNNKKKN